MDGGLRRRLRGRQIRFSLNRDGNTGAYSLELAPNHVAEKNFVQEVFVRPYRKPTQVDGMSILRCSSEP
jgi:hypothetical protein